MSISRLPTGRSATDRIGAMGRIKVMQITHDLHIGGLQRVVVDLARGMDKKKFEVSVCALREGGPLEKELAEGGIEVLRMPSTGGRADYFRFWKLYKVMMEKKPSVVHTHNTEPLTDGATAALLAGVPVKVHTDHARRFPDKVRYMFSEWLLSHFITQVVAVSDYTRNDLVWYEKIRPDKIKVVLNGIVGDKYAVPIDVEKKKADLEIDPGRTPVLGTASRLTPQKGISYLLKAVKRLSHDFPDVLLLIAGEGELWDVLNAEVKELGMERHVMFLGPRLDMHEIFQLFDIFILPSLYEGLPLVLLEAMAASRAIVATGVGGVGQAVLDGGNAILVKPEDPDAIYRAVKRLSENSVMRERFSKKSLELFRQSFNLERMIKAYETIYLEGLSAVK